MSEVPLGYRPPAAPSPGQGRLTGWALCACLLAGPASAQVDFVYAGDHAFPPHEYLDEDGSPAGFNVEVIRLLARESGARVEIRLGPWSEQLQAFERGDADVMSLAYSELRAERYAWLVQIWTLRQGLLFRPGRARYPAGLDELAGEVVAVERDGGVHERLLALPESQRPGIHPMESHRDACLALRNGEVTAVVGGQLTLRYFARRVGLEDTVEVVGNSYGYHLATMPDKADRFAFLADTFARVEGTDAINRLAERAFALPGPEPALPWRALLPAVAVAGLALGLVVLWNRALRSQVEARTKQLQESERERRKNERLAVLGNVVAAVAHEVRNPLFAISANVDVLETRLGEADENRRNLASLRSSVERLSHLMQDLLEYGRPETVKLERAESLEQVIDDALETAAPLAATRGVRLTRRFEQRPPPLDIDRRRLSRALLNLVENAVQFAPRDGEVTLSVASPEPGWVEIRVEDPGPGFAPEALERAFEPFYSRRQGGTGLGLAIVERITAGHGGRVGVRNRSAGGAAVWIRLPVPPAGAAQASTP